VVAGLGGVLILGEQITVGMLLGMGLIILGLSLIHQRQQPGPVPVVIVQNIE